MISDYIRFPPAKRDYEGLGECGETLSCVNPLCAGGKLRLHEKIGDQIVGSNEQEEKQVMRLGQKQARHKDGVIDEDRMEKLKKQLGVGMSSFSSAAFAQVGGAALPAKHKFEAEAVKDDDDDNGAVAKKAKKADGDGGGGGGVEDTAAATAEQREVAQSKLDKALVATLELANEAIGQLQLVLDKVPDDADFSRVRASCDNKLIALQQWTQVCTMKKSASVVEQEWQTFAKEDGSKVADKLEKLHCWVQLSNSIDTLGDANLNGGDVTQKQLEEDVKAREEQIEIAKEMCKAGKKSAGRLENAEKEKKRRTESKITKQEKDAEKTRIAQAKAAAKSAVAPPAPVLPASSAVAQAIQSLGTRVAQSAPSQGLLAIDWGKHGHEPLLEVPASIVLNGTFDVTRHLDAPFLVKGGQSAMIDVNSMATPRLTYIAFKNHFLKKFKTQPKQRASFGIPPGDHVGELENKFLQSSGNVHSIVEAF